MHVVTAESAERPNFLVILCDDLGYGDLGCYGHPVIKTPQLDKLAKEGVRLTACYSAAPVCSPARAGLLTGQIPNRLGIYDFLVPASSKAAKKHNRSFCHLRAGEPTISSLLKETGYATCLAGKWHLNTRFNKPQRQPTPGDAGFDHWFATGNNASPLHKDPTNFVRNGEKVGKLTGFSCQLVVDEALTWLKQQQTGSPDQPFFLYVAFHEPHEPIASPGDLVAKYERKTNNHQQAEYFANVENMDDATGRLIEALDEMGLRDNTMIVFTSDNGPETLGRYGPRSRRSYGTPGPLRGMKLWTTEAGFRVPGIVSWPGVVPAGKKTNAAVSSLDLLPTFCQLANVRLPEGATLDGVDCLPLVKGEVQQRDKPLLWCFYDALNERRVAMRVGDWKVLARLADENGNELPPVSNLAADNYEQYKNARLKDHQIFRVEHDLAEKHDLAKQNRSDYQRLKKLMEESYRELIADSHVWESPK